MLKMNCHINQSNGSVTRRIGMKLMFTILGLLHLRKENLFIMLDFSILLQGCVIDPKGVSLEDFDIPVLQYLRLLHLKKTQRKLVILVMLKMNCHLNQRIGRMWRKIG